MTTGYARTVQVAAGFEETVEATRVALAGEGFGVLCEIDVQATMKAKLGLDRDPYLILGACNPPLAHQALDAEPEIGVLLPCNVVVWVRDGVTQVSAVAADRMLQMVGNDALAPLADEVSARLGRVLERVSG
ncbi:MAG: DUF302 domain-containing protein [Actinomycetota bacterium]